MKQYRGELEPAVLAQNGRTGAMICQNGDDVLQSISMRKWIGLGRYRQPIFHYGRFVNGIHHGKNGFLLRTLNLDANQSCSLLRLARLDCVIQQVGKPMELYDHPVNKFVAGFIGSPQMNFFDVTLKGNEVTFEDGNKLMLPEAILKKLNGKEGEMTLGIRGEDLKMDAQNLELYKENKMKAVITDTEVMGNENNLYFQFGGCQAVARVSKYEISQVGDEIEFVFMPSKIHFFDKETEMNYL